MPLIQTKTSADMTLSVEKFIRYMQKYSTDKLGIEQIPNAVDQFCNMSDFVKQRFHNQEIIVSLDNANKTLNWHNALFQIDEIMCKAYKTLPSNIFDKILQILTRFQNIIARIEQDQLGLTNFMCNHLAIAKQHSDDSYSVLTMKTAYTGNTYLEREHFWYDLHDQIEQHWISGKTIVFIIENSIKNNGYCEAIVLEGGHNSVLNEAVAKDIHYDGCFDSILEYLDQYYTNLRHAI